MGAGGLMRSAGKGGGTSDGKWGNWWGNPERTHPRGPGRGRTCRRRHQVGADAYSPCRTAGGQLLISGFWVRVPGGSPDTKQPLGTLPRGFLVGFSGIDQG